MAGLSKTRTVLHHRDSFDNPNPLFSAEPIQEGEIPRFTTVRLDHDVWVDMGQPTEITVTIRPGDKLNK